MRSPCPGGSEEPGLAASTGSNPALVTQKGSDLLEKARIGGLVFQNQTVATLQLDKAGARNAGCDPPAALERRARIATRMHHQGRHAHLAEQIPHIRRAAGLEAEHGSMR